MTNEQLKRLSQEWEAITKEPIELEQIGGAIYGFGSELATLRLLKSYRHTQAAVASYSDNRKTFYFRLEV